MASARGVELDLSRSSETLCARYFTRRMPRWLPWLLLCASSTASLAMARAAPIIRPHPHPHAANPRATTKPAKPIATPATTAGVPWAVAHRAALV